MSGSVILFNKWVLSSAGFSKLRVRESLELRLRLLTRFSEFREFMRYTFILVTTLIIIQLSS